MDKISCIVPAYNEEKRIGNVLKILESHPLVDELIVINDGSVDNTDKIIRKFSCKVISFKKNRGKSYAVAKGIESAKNNIILLVDSDLEGLKKRNVSDLIFPVKNEEADITISIRKNSIIIYRLLGLDFVSGDRVFRKNLIKNLEEIKKLPGYGLECFLNEIIIKKRLRLNVVNWKNVVAPGKHAKIGFFKGMFKEIPMIKQIIKTVGAYKMFNQSFKMLSLKVN